MRVVESVRDLRGDEERELGGQREAPLLRELQERAQVLALDVLHGDVVPGVDLPEIVDVRDVVVVELGRELRLVDEHRHEFGVRRHVRHDALDRDDLLEALLAFHARLEDLGHAARADLLEELVAPERARRRGGTSGRRPDVSCRPAASSAAARAERAAGSGTPSSAAVSPETSREISRGRAGGAGAVVFGGGMIPESVSLRSLSTEEMLRAWDSPERGVCCGRAARLAIASATFTRAVRSAGRSGREAGGNGGEDPLAGFFGGRSPESVS